MFKARFTKIKDISERRRLPRLGKIRLGIKVVSQKTGKEFPREVDYFVVPPEVAKVYGERPTSLDVMFPINDLEVVFPQAYKWYGGQRGLKCVGNGEQALRLIEKTLEMEEVECKAEQCEHMKSGECQRIGHLMVILPRINMGGVYQIDVGSYHSIVDVNSGLEYVQALVGRFAMVPLRLTRIPKETHFGGQKQIHYTLQVFADLDVDMLNNLRENTSRVLLSTRNLALPPPEIDENGVIVEEEVDEEEIDVKSKKLPAEKEYGGRVVQEGESAGKISPLQLIAVSRLLEQKGLNYNEKALKSLSYLSAQKLIKALQADGIDPEEIQMQFQGLIY